MDEPLPDIDAWAKAHGFTPSDDQVGGTTQLLDLGILDTTDAAYRGAVDGHEAVLAEFSVGSPDWSEAFGGFGIDSTGFTVFLMFVDAGRWSRLTVHPSAFSEQDWARRLLRADRRVHTSSAGMDERYRIVASRDIPDEQLEAVLTPELVGWWVAQDPEVLLDIEDHGEEGGFLTVARLGMGIGDEALSKLHGQTAHLLNAFFPA
ncbi:MAG TPA: hypothetical protein VFX13_04695 [Gaiellales bacterium]|jgi:hypothetical protein|nr:hypothetical protein [Gaiellales bacterium]